MYKTLLSILIGLAVTFSGNVFAENTTTTTTTTVETVSVKDSLFNKNELSLNLGTGYSGVESSFSEPYYFNLEGGVDYYFTKHVGLNASVPFYFKNGFRLEEVSVGATGRLPLGVVAPYLGANFIYNWERENTDYLAKAGAELRLNKGWGIFAEGRYRVNGFNSADVENGAWSLVGGVRLVLF